MLHFPNTFLTQLTSFIYINTTTLSSRLLPNHFSTLSLHNSLHFPTLSSHNSLYSSTSTLLLFCLDYLLVISLHFPYTTYYTFSTLCLNYLVVKNVSHFPTLSPHNSLHSSISTVLHLSLYDLPTLFLHFVYTMSVINPFLRPFANKK